MTFEISATRMFGDFLELNKFRTEEDIFHGCTVEPRKLSMTTNVSGHSFRLIFQEMQEILSWGSLSLVSNQTRITAFASGPPIPLNNTLGLCGKKLPPLRTYLGTSKTHLEDIHTLCRDISCSGILNDVGLGPFPAFPQQKTTSNMLSKMNIVIQY